MPPRARRSLGNPVRLSEHDLLTVPDTATVSRRSTRKKPLVCSDEDGDEDWNGNENKAKEDTARNKDKASAVSEHASAVTLKATTSRKRHINASLKKSNTRATETKVHLSPVTSPPEPPQLPTDSDYLELFIHGTTEGDNLDDSEENKDLSTTAGSSNQRQKGLIRPRFDRALRLAARHTHLSCLLFAYSRKSLFLGTPILKAETLSRVPSHLLRQFSPEIIADGRTLINALSMLANWWKNSIKRTSHQDKSKSKAGLRHDIRFRLVSEIKMGTDEDLVAVFVVILRSLTLKTRLVCSLQPLLVHPIEPLSLDVETEAPPVPISRPRITQQKVPGGMAVIRHSTKDSPTKGRSQVIFPPKFWCEVLHPCENRWIAVDCLRGIVNDRLSMEPPALSSKLTHQNQHLFLIAYDEKGRAVDVSRRYTSRFYGVTAKLRRHDDIILNEVLPLLKGHISDSEAHELANLVDGEPLPKTLAGFRGHGRYLLESQVKKYEIFWPPEAGIVGEFRGETVRLRSVVQKIRSKEAWYRQFGRIIKEGEEPCKQVALPKKPERKSKQIADWEQAVEDATRHAMLNAGQEVVMQPLFGEWQTEPFSPPVAFDGKVPRNKFGNVDLYLPSMIPVGCTWIDNDSAYLAARDLGVDYAAACVCFAFSGRLAVPNLRGIVVCAEFEGAVLRRLEEMKAEIEEARRQAEIKKEAKRVRLEAKKQAIRDKLLGNSEYVRECDNEADPASSKDVRIVSTLVPNANANVADDATDFDSLF